MFTAEALAIFEPRYSFFSTLVQARGSSYLSMHDYRRAPSARFMPYFVDHLEYGVNAIPIFFPHPMMFPMFAPAFPPPRVEEAKPIVRNLIPPAGSPCTRSQFSFFNDSRLRRSPFNQYYRPQLCPFASSASNPAHGHCPNEGCELCHSRVELVWHPVQFKTSRCMGHSCKGIFECAFTHSELESRAWARWRERNAQYWRDEASWTAALHSGSEFRSISC